MTTPKTTGNGRPVRAVAANMRPGPRYPFLRLHLHNDSLVDTLIALNDRILARRAAHVTEVS